MFEHNLSLNGGALTIANSGSISVRLTRRNADGEPLAGVVYILERGEKTAVTAITDTDGVLDLDDLCEGDYRLREAAAAHDNTIVAMLRVRCGVEIL